MLGVLVLQLIPQPLRAEEFNPSQHCWTKTACEEKKGQYDEAPSECPDEGKGKCYAPKPEVFLSVPIPRLDKSGGEYTKAYGIADYIAFIFTWSIRVIGMLAVVMIMVAGFQWMTAAGNSATIGQAKTRMFNAVMGVILVAGSYLILNFINPALVNFKGIRVEMVPTIQQSTMWCEDLADELKQTLDPKDGNCGEKGKLEGRGDCIFKKCSPGQGCAPMKESRGNYKCEDLTNLCENIKDGGAGTCNSDENIALAEKYAKESNSEESCRKRVINLGIDFCAFADMWPSVSQDGLKGGGTVFKRISCYPGKTEGYGSEIDLKNYPCHDEKAPREYCTDDERANVAVDDICVAFYEKSEVHCRKQCDSNNETVRLCNTYNNQTDLTYADEEMRCSDLCCVRIKLLKP